MRCVHCEAPLPDQAMFCGECGSAVRPTAEQTPRAEAVPDDSLVPEVSVVDPAIPDAGETAIVHPDDGTGPGDEPAADGDDIDGEVDQVEESTAFAARVGTASFTLHFSTGETVTVTGSGLIGRRPVAQPGEYFDEYVAIDDPGRSVSKTHLEFGQEGGAFWISDRFSANGTVVREPERSPRLCPGGRRTRVARGSRIDIGEQFFLIA